MVHFHPTEYVDRSLFEFVQYECPAALKSPSLVTPLLPLVFVLFLLIPTLIWAFLPLHALMPLVFLLQAALFLFFQLPFSLLIFAQFPFFLPLFFKLLLSSFFLLLPLSLALFFSTLPLFLLFPSTSILHALSLLLPSVSSISDVLQPSS